MGRNLVLIGLMGAGKSTIGKILAGRLHRSFLDTDRVVERMAGRRVAEIFATEGEAAFRRLEARAVADVAAAPGRIIAVGGGAVLDPRNVDALRSGGDVVWLDAHPAELARRVRRTGDRIRPLLGDDHLAQLRTLDRERRGAYQAAAHHVVQTGGRPKRQVAAEIERWARGRPGLLDAGEMAR